MATCRSCGKQILWARSQSDKPMPFDAEPVLSGTPLAYILRPEPGKAPRAVLAKLVPDVLLEGKTLYVSHFATCPNAAEHRKDT